MILANSIHSDFLKEVVIKMGDTFGMWIFLLSSVRPHLKHIIWWHDLIFILSSVQRTPSVSTCLLHDSPNGTREKCQASSCWRRPQVSHVWNTHTCKHDHELLYKVTTSAPCYATAYRSRSLRATVQLSKQNCTNIVCLSVTMDFIY